jgi:hypothetical protein
MNELEEILLNPIGANPEEAFWMGGGAALLYGIKEARNKEELKKRIEKFEKHLAEGLKKKFSSAQKLSKLFENYKKQVLK